MNDVLYQIGIGIGIVLGLLGLVAFLWTLRSRQYEDLDGADSRDARKRTRPEMSQCEAGGFRTGRLAC